VDSKIMGVQEVYESVS